uniref:Uncharacterized protein n=1 Tax=Branchiostoma floridae TaxID=7739 RepID=C3Z0H9_BRAFL|eukprot:XP_002598015.1 hypothetical protein BRAFLDRAFT_79759 [Branchiostoma floridae]
MNIPDNTPNTESRCLRAESGSKVVTVPLAVVSQTSAQGQAGDKEPKDKILERILELERELFTVDVFNDPVRYRKVRKLFKKHKALLKRALKGSVILLLTFLRQTDMDRFYHNHYRVGEGSLSQQLSHILISEHLQDKVKGAQLIVRLQVKHEDYLRVRGRLGQGLDRTTSVDNLLTLPPPNRQVDHSSLRALDLAVVGREDQSCAEGRDHNSTPKFRVRQMQAVVRTGREKAEGLARQLQELQIKQGLTQTAREETEATEYLLSKEVIRRTEQKEKAGKILEQKLEIQHLKETNNSMAATIVELTAENTRISNRLADIPKLCEEVRKWREKDKTSQKVLSEHEVEIQRLQETNKSMAATIEELLEGKHTLADGFSAAATSQDSRKSLLQRFMGLFSSREDRFETPADPAVGSVDDESGPLRLDGRITTGSIDDESGPRRLYGRTTIGSIEESPRYDVFISYSSKESPWEELMPACVQEQSHL